MPRLRSRLLIELTCPGRQSAIRPALARLRDGLRPHLAGCPDDMADSVEIALAEVLNNIVEHAGASEGEAAIRIAVRDLAGGVAIRVSDDGGPMPGLRLPEGRAQDPSVPTLDLPEGGFGWGLIRALTCGLSYRRAGGRNELALRFACTCPGADGREGGAENAPAPKRPN